MFSDDDKHVSSTSTTDMMDMFFSGDDDEETKKKAVATHASSATQSSFEDRIASKMAKNSVSAAPESVNPTRTAATLDDRIASKMAKNPVSAAPESVNPTRTAATLDDRIASKMAKNPVSAAPESVNPTRTAATLDDLVASIASVSIDPNEVPDTIEPTGLRRSVNANQESMLQRIQRKEQSHLEPVNEKNKAKDGKQSVSSPRCSKKVKIIIIITVIIIIALGVGIPMSMRKSSNPPSSPPPSLSLTPSPTSQPLPPPTLPPLVCYSSTAEIYDREKDVEDIFIPREYHLCSNSVIEIGTFDKTTETFEAGKNRPLIIIHPNIAVMCGDDGRSSNNCTFKGGTYQTEFFKYNSPYFKAPTYLENVTLQGITFTGSEDANIAFFSSGIPTHLNVKDCIFTKNTLNFNILIDSRNSSLVIEDSVFTENIIEALTDVGLGTSACIYSYSGPSVTIKNCIFLKNTLRAILANIILATVLVYDDETYANNGELSTTQLNITDSCFDENLRNTYSLVLTDAKNYYSRNNRQADNTFALPANANLEECPGLGDPLRIDDAKTHECKEEFILGGCA